jgi:hypothetical protein
MERLLRLGNTLLFLSGLTLTAQGQEFGCDSLNTILEATRGFDFKERKAFAERKYASFDFKKFVGFGKPSASNYFKVGTDNEGRLVYVTHVDSRKKGNLGSYKLSFYFIAEFTVITIGEDDENNKLVFEPRVFIRFSDHGNFYLINYHNLFEKLRVRTGGFIPFDDFSELYSIMYFDSDFKPQKLIRLNHGEIMFSSTFVYTGNTEKELITLYPKNLDVKVNNSTCLSTLTSKLEDILFIMIESKAAKGKGYENVPTWLWGGTHHYRID